MSIFKCIIIDDDYGSISVIEKYIKQLDEFEIIGKFTDPIKAFSEINNLNPDLIFLDIEMPNLSGIELIKLVSGKRNFILITASNKYAIEGFELDVIDYLMKPLEFDRFFKAINKFRKLNENILADNNKKRILYVNENYKTIKIDVNEIYYLEAAKEYVQIFTNDRTIKTKQSLKYFEDILTPFSFIRIHKSFIVSIDRIDAYTKSLVEVNGITLPIGRSYKNKINFNELIKHKF